ncbi:MAG: hypothetical protein AAB473_01525 [Patescibacteria group bacterium]
MKKDDIFGGVILLIVIAAIGAFLYFAQSAPELSYGPVELAGSVLSAAPKSTTEVTISGTLVKSGFVTIHQAMGTAPGEIVGTSDLIVAGIFTDVVVHLAKPMEYAGPYVALLHVDNGDGVFVVKDDMPVTSSGVSVRADFNSPPEVK